MTELVLYNTRTRRKQPFEPLEAGHVRVYTCGPTVYAAQHIGNLRSQLFADLVKRALLAEDWSVTHVINITDVGHLVSDAESLDPLRRQNQITAKHTQFGGHPHPLPGKSAATGGSPPPAAPAPEAPKKCSTAG